MSKSIQTTVRSVNYTGGIIGLFIDRRQKLEMKINEMNAHGYRLRQVLPAKNSIFTVIIQLICLFFSFLLWAPERGETLIFERMVEEVGAYSGGSVEG